MAKKQKKVKTLVCFVLDETGSMLSYKQQTIDGYNEYIDGLRKEKKFSIMLTRFNKIAINIGAPEPIAKATKLDHENYRPDQLTPLYDAIGQTIRKAETLQDDYKATLFVIMTDGLENASKEFTMKGIFDLIEEKAKNGWTFAYLGANQDAYIESEKVGIPKINTMNYSPARTEDTFAAAAKASASYSARGSSAGASGMFGDFEEDLLTEEQDAAKKSSWVIPDVEGIKKSQTDVDDDDDEQETTG